MGVLSYQDTDLGGERMSSNNQLDNVERFTFVLTCPKCDHWVATTTEVTALNAPPKCYCPDHDDWVEMVADRVDNPQPPEEQGVRRA